MAVNPYAAVKAPSHQAPNVNGLKPSVLINSRENVLTYPVPKTIASASDLGIMTGDYTITTGKPFTPVALDHEVSNVMHEGPGGAFGPFKTSCKMFVRGSKADVDGFANQVQYDEIVAVIPQADGSRKPIGNADFPARVVAKYDSKSVSASDPRGWEFEIVSFSKYAEVLDSASVVPLT